jgi:nucleoid-associated protein YgaU
MTLQSQLPRTGIRFDSRPGRRRGGIMILAGTLAIGTAGAGAAWWWSARTPDTGPIPVIAFDATVPGATAPSAAAPLPAPAQASTTPAPTVAQASASPAASASDARVASVEPPRAAAQPAAASAPNPGAPQGSAQSAQAPATSPATVPGAASASTGPASATPASIGAQGGISLAEACTLVTREPLRARAELTRLIESRILSGDDLSKACAAVNAVNDTLLWSSTLTPGDLICTSYMVKKGDTLSQIAKRNDVQADWRVIMRINGLRNERDVRVGRTLKLPTTAFHAEVSKRDYRIYLYAGEGPSRVLVGAYDVGLGEFDSTPTGMFMVRPRSKLINPEWRNPRTGEHYFPDDPKNPIGERWIGLVGVEQANSGIKGYGIHGTVDPASIGQQASMGCVRMLPPGLDITYELLTEPNSTILIRQ